MKTMVIVNPNARPVLRRARNGLPPPGFAPADTEVLHPGDSAEARRLAFDAVSAGARIIVIVGGDGSVNAALPAVAGTGTALALIPTGSANDLARCNPIPLNHAQAWALAASGSTRKVDLLLVNGRPVATAGGFGFPCDVACRANQLRRTHPIVSRLPGLRGSGVYIRGRPRHADRLCACRPGCCPGPGALRGKDRLAEAMRDGVTQYVAIGAGLDTFALRRSDLQDRLLIIEIDHPATQASKQTRIRDAGLTPPPHLHFAPADLEKESLAEVLSRTPYDPAQLSFFSWLGVTMYLTIDAIRATLRSLRGSAAAGSQLVFDYLDRAVFAPDNQSPTRSRLFETVRRMGEPMIFGFDPSALPHRRLPGSAKDIAERFLPAWPH